MERLILHWTAGPRRATDHDLCSYHYLIEDQGQVRLKAGVPVERNDRDVRGFPSYCSDSSIGYAAHTRAFNSGSIGLSVCGMASAVDKRPEGKVEPGPAPMTQNQIKSLIGTSFSLLKMYDLPVRQDTIFTHYEAEALHNVPQRGKWDITWIPGKSLGRDEAGPWIREQVKRFKLGKDLDI